jgi:hypothetical protein
MGLFGRARGDVGSSCASCTRSLPRPQEPACGIPPLSAKAGIAMANIIAAITNAASAYSVPWEGWPCTVALRLPLGVWTAFPSQGCVPPSAVHVPLRSVLTAPPPLPPSGAPPSGGWPCTVALRLPLGVWTTFMSQGCVVPLTVHVALSSSEWTAPPPLPPLAAKAGAVVATIIAAMTNATTTNEMMRLISATSFSRGAGLLSPTASYNAPPR